MSNPSKQAEAASIKSAKASVGEGNPALRMMGLPRLRAKLPSRNWTIFLTLTGSFATAIFYDRHHKKNTQQKWCNAVSHLSTEILPINRVPRKLTVFLSAPPGDGLQPAREYFTEYVKPVLVAAAVDWEIVEGRNEGDLRFRLAEKIRKARRAVEHPPSEDEEEPDMVKAIRERFGTTEEDSRGGDLVIGRHTWKEYIRGLHEGWLGPLDTPPDLEPKDPAADRPATEDSVTGEPAQAESKTVFDSNPTDAKFDSAFTTNSEISVGDADPATAVPKDDAPPISSNPENPKQKPKTTAKPPYLFPNAYPSAPLAASTPAPFPPSATLAFPHLLGFLNTPIRIYRFLNKRHLSDTAGHQVASLLLSPTPRPYEHPPSSPSASNSDTPTSTSTLGSNPTFTTAEDTASQSVPWEQQLLLLAEESDWHKSAYKPNPDSGPDHGKERPWTEPMVIDPRIGARMRTLDAIPDPDLAAAAVITASSGGPPGTASMSEGSGWAPAGFHGHGDAATKGNSREWKGGAERPERRGWGTWAKELVGLEAEEAGCKGWEQGRVGDEEG